MKKKLAALALALCLCLCSPQALAAFSDVSASAYYSQAVAWAVERSITGGTSETTFSPDAPCTTAQILTFLWRAKGSPAPASSVNPFSDAAESDYFYQAALWAHEQGLASGAALNPDAACTRAQTVSYLWILAGRPVPEPGTVTAQEGERTAYGILGDTLVNCFFSYQVLDAAVVDAYESIPADEGKELLAVDVAVENVSGRTIPMFDTDFQLQWGPGDQDFGYPAAAAAGALPASYSLAPGESVTGTLVYQIPAGSRDFTLATRESFDDGAAGRVFYCRFAAGEEGAVLPGLFPDVPSSSAFAPAVLWAVQEGIASGTGADSFSPEAACTRAQIAVFLYRAYGSRDPVSGE